MCKICNLVKQFPHVKLGEQHYNNNIAIMMDSKDPKHILEFLGYTVVRFANEMIDSGDEDYEDNDDDKEFFEKVLQHKGCNTPICKEFLDSWKIIMEGICKFIDGENLIELPCKDYHDELIIFGYKWASYDLKSEKEEIDTKIAEQIRFLDDESLKFHELINKICVNNNQ
jgi:hypothetical protein